MGAHFAGRNERTRVILMGSGIALLVAASSTGLALNASDSSGHTRSAAAAKPPATAAADPASKRRAGDSVDVGDVSNSTAPAASTPPVTSTKTSPSTSAGSKPAATTASPGRVVSKPKSVTYVVKKGDNLTVIAAWFNEHGYGDLYRENKSVIGSDPNLIFPGQHITISRAGAMTLSH